jgi:arsenate reductase
VVGKNPTEFQAKAAALADMVEHSLEYSVGMAATDPVMRGHLNHVVNALVNESKGAVEREQIRAMVDEAYDEVSEGARIEQFIPILTMRQARLLLHARRRLTDGKDADHTDVLLVCGTNAGRSQVAASLLRFYAPGHLDVLSAGQNPAEETNPEVVAYMREHGVELTDYPKRLRPEYVDLADYVVFVGSNDTQVPPDKDTERWPIQHMTGLNREEMRQAIGEIDDRVRAFVARVLPEVKMPPSIFEQRP